MILESIDELLKTSLKAGNSEMVSVLRFLKSAIKNAEIEKQNKLNEKDIIGVLRKEAKKRQDSIALYQDGGRVDLAEKEKKELAIIERFLPQAMSETDASLVADRIIKETGAKTIADMGRVMAGVLASIGDRADGSMISLIVRSKLQ